MRMIITAGMPGSGKEEFLNAASGTGVPFLRMGDIVREYYSKRDPKDSELSVGGFANIERERFGFDIWAKRATEKMHGDIFIIDGCRSMDEVRSYLGITPDVHVVAIFTSPNIRYERLVKRGRDDAPKDIDEFRQRDEREISWGLAETMVLADKMIINESSLDDFKKNVVRTMEELNR